MNKKVVIIIGILVVILGAFLAKNKSTFTNKVKDQSEETVVQNMDNSYINEKYGYSIDPPDEFELTFSSTNDDYGAGWTWTKGEADRIELYIHPINTNFYTPYKELSKLELNSSVDIKHQKYTLIEVKRLGDFLLVLAKVDKIPNSGSDNPSGYTAIWLRGEDDSVILDMYDHRTTYENKELFFDLVNSLQFI